jgi:hypothetical protein
MTVCNHKSIPTAHFIPNSLSTFLHNPSTVGADEKIPFACYPDFCTNIAIPATCPNLTAQ